MREKTGHDPALRGPLRAEALVAISGVLLVLAGGALLRHSAVDLPITQAIAEHGAGFLGAMASAVYLALEPPYAVGLTVLCAAIVWWQVDLKRGIAFGMTVAFAWLPVWLIKLLVDRPRPNVGALAPTLADSSYPSGHTAFVTVLAITLIIVTTGTVGQTATRVLAPFLVIVVGGSVLLLGVHFPTDVLASVVWSIAVTPLASRAATALAERPPGSFISGRREEGIPRPRSTRPPRR